MKEKFELIERRLKEAKDLYEWERGGSFLAILIVKSLVEKMTKDFWLTAAREYDKREDNLRKKLIDLLLDIRLIKEMPVDKWRSSTYLERWLECQARTLGDKMIK